MSKRYTDPAKWSDDWFIDLSPEMKVAWVYLCDNCSWGGFWKVSKRIYEVHTGCRFSESDILSAMAGRVVDIGNGIWHIGKFVDFQQGKLNPNSRFHASIIAEQEKYLGANEGLIRGFDGSNKALCNGNGNGKEENVQNTREQIHSTENEHSASISIPVVCNDTAMPHHMDKFLVFIECHPYWGVDEVQARIAWRYLCETEPSFDPDIAIESAKAYRQLCAMQNRAPDKVKRPHNFLKDGEWARSRNVQAAPVVTIEDDGFWQNIGKKEIANGQG